MSQKLLIISLTPEEHKGVARYALELDTTMSNLVRHLLGLPEVQRGRPRSKSTRVAEDVITDTEVAPGGPQK
jgi:hypothetical protein